MFEPILAKIGTVESAENFADGVVQPAAILPVQYYSKIRDPESEGELRLLAAVLEDAVRSYLTNCNAVSTQRRQEYWECKRWFQSGRHDRLCDFETICGLLDIDPDAVRLSLVRATRGPQRTTAQPRHLARMSRQAA